MNTQNHSQLSGNYNNNSNDLNISLYSLCSVNKLII